VIMMDETRGKLDKVCTDVAVLAAQQTEMSKRLSEQAGSIRVLNDAHLNTEVKLTEIIGGQNANGYRIDSLEQSIKNSIRNWGTIITIGVTIVTFIINYLLN